MRSDTASPELSPLLQAFQVTMCCEKECVLSRSTCSLGDELPEIMRVHRNSEARDSYPRLRGGVCLKLSVCFLVCASVVSVCLSVCPPVCMSACLYVFSVLGQCGLVRARLVCSELGWAGLGGAGLVCPGSGRSGNVLVKTRKPIETGLGLGSVRRHRRSFEGGKACPADD